VHGAGTGGQGREGAARHWPRKAYVAVFLTDDSPRQRATIKRLATFPAVTRVVRIRYSDRQRDRVQRRIADDYEVLEKAGFEAVEADADTGTDRVDVYLSSRRKDAARYFRRRYGPMVRTHVTPGTTVPGCARASTYTIAPDGMSLNVSWSDAPKAQRIEVTERPGYWRSASPCATASIPRASETPAARRPPS
jgi:hypothetical protein